MPVIVVPHILHVNLGLGWRINNEWPELAWISSVSIGPSWSRLISLMTSNAASNKHASTSSRLRVLEYREKVMTCDDWGTLYENGSDGNTLLDVESVLLTSLPIDWAYSRGCGSVQFDTEVRFGLGRMMILEPKAARPRRYSWNKTRISVFL